jgi:hypothetical protein
MIVLAIVAAYAAVVALPPLRAPFRMAAPTLEDAVIVATATLLLWLGLAILQLADSVLRPRADAVTALEATTLDPRQDGGRRQGVQ